MYHESDLFLPSSNDQKQVHQHHRSPCLSTGLFQLYEQSWLYASCIFLIFVYAAYIGTLTTHDGHRETSEPVLFYVELILLIYSFIELLLRIYASECKVRYRGCKGKGRFFYEHYLFMDVIVCISSACVFLFYWLKFFDKSSMLFLHALRFIQLIRFIPLDRHVGAIPLISRSLCDYHRVLLATLFLCYLLVLPTAYLLWIVERTIETDGKYFFRTYTDSLWFTINSMATVNEKKENVALVNRFDLILEIN
jgi:hypothetical protein